MTACKISNQKDASGNLGDVYSTPNGVYRADVSNGLAPWTGDPSTLTECVITAVYFAGPLDNIEGFRPAEV